jgi:hypothetical protein
MNEVTADRGSDCPAGIMIRREWLYAVLVLTGGVLGGYAGGRISSTAGATIVQPPQRTMTAQEIVLVDAKGEMRGTLEVNKEGDAGLSLFDHQGKLRTKLEISDTEGLAFKLFDPMGVVRLSLIINRDRIPALRLFDSQHRPRVLLGVDPEGEAALDFYSEEGKLLRELP